MYTVVSCRNWYDMIHKIGFFFCQFIYDDCATCWCVDSRLKYEQRIVYATVRNYTKIWSSWGVLSVNLLHRLVQTSVCAGSYQHSLLLLVYLHASKHFPWIIYLCPNNKKVASCFCHLSVFVLTGACNSRIKLVKACKFVYRLCQRVQSRMVACRPK